MSGPRADNSTVEFEVQVQPSAKVSARLMGAIV